MEKYKIDGAILVVEDKTFIGNDSQVLNYKDYSLLIKVNNTPMQIKIDKSDKKRLETLIELGLVENIK